MNARSVPVALIMIVLALSGAWSYFPGSPATALVLGENHTWFAPLDYETCEGCTDKGSIDFWSLFANDAPWMNSSKHVDVFKFYGGEIKTANDSELKQAVDDLNRRGIAIAFEAGPLTATSSCGNGIEGFPDGVNESVLIANRMKEAGGLVRFIAMDEPFGFASLYSGPQACRWSPEKVASEVAKYIQAVRTVFPDVVVGDTEPFWQGLNVEDYERWMSAFQNVTGSPLPFFHLDMDWTRDDWPQAALQLEAYAHDHGVKFGIIYNGDGADQTDQEWLTHAEERMVRYEAQYGGRPDQVLFQSWNDKPDHVLPETEPYTFTNLILRYFRERTTLDFSITDPLPDGSRALAGNLSQLDGTPLVGVGIGLFARPVDGPGLFAETSVSGTVPSNANKADVGFRVNLECGCVGNGDFTLYWVRYTEGSTPVNHVPNSDFSAGLNGWGYWGNATVGLEPSDRGSGSMLHVVVTHSQSIGMNSGDFAVTPGANYTVVFGARIAPVSVGSGYLSLVFLGQTEVLRRTIHLEPPPLTVGNMTTDASGAFGFVLGGLPASTLLLQAEYLGDDDYWPAYAATTLRTPSAGTSPSGVDLVTVSLVSAGLGGAAAAGVGLVVVRRRRRSGREKG